MRVMVTGSREWTDEGLISAVLAGLRWEYPNLTVIEGCARGADYLATAWAQANHGVKLQHFPASEYDSPLFRNLAMLATEPDLVVAFKDGFGANLYPSGIARGGTEHAVRHAQKRGIKTWVISHGI